MVLTSCDRILEVRAASSPTTLMKVVCLFPHLDKHESVHNQIANLKDSMLLAVVWQLMQRQPKLWKLPTLGLRVSMWNKASLGLRVSVWKPTSLGVDSCNVVWYW